MAAELHRRASQGRFSEMIGPAGLEMDIQTRTAGLARVGSRIMAKSSPETVAAAESYTAGVNAGLSQENTFPRS